MLLGGFHFPNKTGNMVHGMFCQHLINLDVCGTFTWGVAVLAFLYRALAKAREVKTAKIEGCTFLFYAWFWLRYPTLAPIIESPSTDPEDFVRFPLFSRYCLFTYDYGIKLSLFIWNHYLNIKIIE